MLTDEGKCGGPRLLEADGGGGDGGEQAAGGVHVDHDGLHALQRLGRLVHDEVGALGDDVELVVGDEGGDLDDDVTGGVEARHLQIHPHQHRRRLPVTL